MKIIEPGMDESNVTIDMVAKKSREFAERFNHLALLIKPIEVVADNMLVYYSERDGIEYDKPEIMITGPSPIQREGDNSQTICSISLEGKESKSKANLEFIPNRRYAVGFSEGTEQNYERGVWIGGFADSRMFWQRATYSKDKRILRHLTPFWKGYTRKVRKGFRQLKENGFQVVRATPYEALKDLDHFVNDVFGEKKIGEIEKENRRELEKMGIYRH